MLFSLERFSRIDSSLIQYAEINKKRNKPVSQSCTENTAYASFTRGHNVFEKPRIVSMSQESRNQQKSYSAELSAMFSKHCGPSMKLSLTCMQDLHMVVKLAYIRCLID